MLVLVRGVPGSGKTTLVEKFFKGWKHIEADMYFLDCDGIYRYNPKEIREAHEWAIEATENALKNRRPTVVANTFVRLWEIHNYTALAKKYNVPYLVVRCTGKYKNVHDVPETVVSRMSENFEDYQDEIIF